MITSIMWRWAFIIVVLITITTFNYQVTFNCKTIFNLENIQFNSTINDFICLQYLINLSSKIFSFWKSIAKILWSLHQKSFFVVFVCSNNFWKYDFLSYKLSYKSIFFSKSYLIKLSNFKFFKFETFTITFRSIKYAIRQCFKFFRLIIQSIYLFYL